MPSVACHMFASLSMKGLLRQSPGVQQSASINNYTLSMPWAHLNTNKSCCYARQQGHAAGAASPLVLAVFPHRAPVRIAFGRLGVLCRLQQRRAP